MTVLTTQRLTLRKPRAADIPGWTDFFLSGRGTWHGGGPARDAGRAWRAWAMMIGHWDIHGFGTFVIEDRATARPVGQVGPWFPIPWPEREIAWGVWDCATQGTGVAAEAAARVLRHVFDDLNWTTAVSYIGPANARSIALARRLGATEDATAERTQPDDLVFRHTPGSCARKHDDAHHTPGRQQEPSP